MITVENRKINVAGQVVEYQSSRVIFLVYFCEVHINPVPSLGQQDQW